MSLILTGNQSNVTTPLTATVSAIANNGSGKWRVTTSAPHLFGNNDYVELLVTISAVTSYYFGFITVIDATHFDVPSLTYTATGTGTVDDLSLTPQIQVPTDGDSFSLQLSGMLSALQALADRTQALRYMQISRAMSTFTVFASGPAPVPPWATHVLAIGFGGGGGAGGGPGGFSGTANQQLSSGSGGAGARRVMYLLQLLGGPTSIDVVIGAGGAGGAGTSGGANPSSASPGADGGSTTATWHDGSAAGQTFATFSGGAGGGGGLNLAASSIVAGSSSIPIFTPGARGPSGLLRSGPAGLLSQTAPGFRQLQNLLNNAGVVSAQAAWQAAVYTDPVGQMEYQEGGASVANGNNATYAAALSYAGAPSREGFSGGAAGANGTASSTYPGGAGGGGGGAGGGGPGGAAGHGGNANSSGNGTNGVAGTAAAANTGGGGGGGGAGGNASGTAGNGAAGAAGGSGYLFFVFMGIPGTP